MAFKKRFCFVFITFGFIGLQASDLKVRLQNIAHREGQILVGIFKPDSDFPDLQSAFATKKIQAKVPEVTLLFEDIPEGRYAVAVFHDKNLNGRLDKNFLGIPREGFGFSRDAPARFGPPAFKAAAFDFNSSLVLKIKLRY